MNNLGDMHFEQRFKSADVSSEINLLLRKEFKDFYELGRKEKVSEIKGYIKTLEVNIINEKLSDSEFRSFAATVVKNLIVNL